MTTETVNAEAGIWPQTSRTNESEPVEIPTKKLISAEILPPKFPRSSRLITSSTSLREAPKGSARASFAGSGSLSGLTLTLTLLSDGFHVTSSSVAVNQKSASLSHSTVNAKSPHTSLTLKDRAPTRIPSGSNRSRTDAQIAPSAPCHETSKSSSLLEASDASSTSTPKLCNNPQSNCVRLCPDASTRRSWARGSRKYCSEASVSIVYR
jgi:hypothetical protein